MRLKVDSLKGGYGKKQILNGISFETNSSDMLYVLGSNGCGKTTLLNMLIGYKEFNTGDISYDNKSIKSLSISDRAKIVSYIPQQHVPAFSYSVLDVVVMGRAGRISFYEAPKQEDYELAYKALEVLGIIDFSDKDYTDLSGGERQLVLIARAICQDSEIILMDEPMQSLDFVNQSMVINAARLLSHEGKCVIMSTHTAINNYETKDKALLMSKDGTAKFGEIETVLDQQNAHNAYGTNLQIVYNTDRKGGRHITCLPLNI